MMTEQPITSFSPQKRLSAWLIHLFTASAAVFGLFTLYAIFRGDYILAFWFMGATIFIDSIDGTLARFFHVKTVVPNIDGALLDNIVDYLNYVITPAFFILVSGLLSGIWGILAVTLIVLASAYQFTQAEAKTPDHFFKGFPSYWNLIVFYLYISHTSAWISFIIIVALAVLIFIPIKYLYLSRLDYVTASKPLKICLLLATLVYAAATLGLLILYPASSTLCVVLSWMFAALYVSISLYRTFVPMPL